MTIIFLIWLLLVAISLFMASPDNTGYRFRVVLYNFSKAEFSYLFGVSHKKYDSTTPDQQTDYLIDTITVGLIFLALEIDFYHRHPL